MNSKALAYAYRLFNYRPRSSKELEERLALRGYDASVIGEIVALFQKQGLIDDERFAKLWALSRIHIRPASLRTIKQELSIKGIGPETITSTLKQLGQDVDEYEIAKNLAQKRLRLLTGVDKLKKKKRVFDYLARRGFSADVIYKALNETMK